MIVKDIMRRDVRCVRLGDRLDAAARAMWERDCGVVPVVDGNGAVVGMLTDRDLCMASWTQARSLAEIPVTAAMARAVRTVRPDDGFATALAAMAALQVRRLPVVDARGVCIGLVALNDFVRLADERPEAVAPAAVLRALAAVGAARGAAAATAAVAAPPAPAADKPADAPVRIAGPVAIPAPTKARKAGKRGGDKGKGGGKGKGRKG
jgi:CBS domain-containing protein